MSGTRMHRDVGPRPGGTTRDLGRCEGGDHDERDKNLGRAATNDAMGSKAANATGNSAGDAATEKDARCGDWVNSIVCQTVAKGASRQCWFYFLGRQFFWSGSFVAYLWRRRSSDHNDYQREEVLQWDVSRTHRVDLDWLFERINLEPKIQIKYIDTKNQLADTLTKGNFTRDEWNHFLCLCNISHFTSTDCSEVMAKRTKRFKWMMTFPVSSSTASERPGKPDTKVKFLWVCKLRSTIEQGDPLYAHTHLATQNGILIKLGLLKSGNLMNWWTIERGDPLFAPRTWFMGSDRRSSSRKHVSE